VETVTNVRENDHVKSQQNAAAIFLSVAGPAQVGFSRGAAEAWGSAWKRRLRAGAGARCLLRRAGLI